MIRNQHRIASESKALYAFGVKRLEALIDWLEYQRGVATQAELKCRLAAPLDTTGAMSASAQYYKHSQGALAHLTDKLEKMVTAIIDQRERERHGSSRSSGRRQ